MTARAGYILPALLCVFSLGCPIAPGPFVNGTAIALDSTDNVYVLGNFNMVFDFDPGPGVENRGDRGRLDIFLVKYDSSGQFQWVCTWDGEFFQGQVHGPLFQMDRLAVDASGTVYLAGIFDFPRDFDPGQGTDVIGPTGANWIPDPFLTKINPDGSYGWTIVWGGPGFEEVLGISTDRAGNIMMLGQYSNQVDFDPGPSVVSMPPPPISTTQVGGTLYGDTYVSLYDSKGSFLQVTTWATEVGNYLARSFYTDYQGNVYLAGGSDQPIDTDPGKGSTILTPTGGTRGTGFISKYDDQLGFQWANLVQQPTGQAGSMAVDGSGNVALGGTSDRGRRDRGYDGFIEVYDSMGNNQWTHRLTGTPPESSIWANPVYDSAGDIFANGTFYGTANLDPGSQAHVYTSSGHHSEFIMKLSGNGSVQWVRVFTTTDRGWISGSAVDSSGNLWLTGDFGERIRFYNGTTATIGNNPGFITPFLVRFDPNGNM